jgi:RimJ/RimL family protein N-acetyltransferase
VTDWTSARSPRLELDRPVPADATGLFEIHHDPGSWTHFPQGRHLTVARTGQMVEDARAQWRADGLGYWTARQHGRIVGWAGCGVPRGLPWWNLAYRFATATHGTGLGAEAGAVAVEAAHDVAPDRPVLAYLLEHNVGSRRTAERLGLRLVWRGPDPGNEDPGAVRLVFLDRDPDDALVAALEAAGMAATGLVR